ncbi:MAG TPA: aldo/keto reductase [Candidatus Polarisedimenticolia bacterium]|nr:aldo/keto reductase [Candidatus Polarisedimenticolia bacterium]
MSPKVNRRTFLKAGLTGTAGISLGLLQARSGADAPDTTPSRPAAGSEPLRGMPRRSLGKTDHEVALFSLGGQATLEQEGAKAHDTAVAIIHRALDLGVNYCDTAPLYGPSQDYYGEVMKTRRKETFLATKTDDRTRDGSLRLLEASLKRLQTDHVDLWQMHHVGSRADLESAFGKGGALEAMVRAKEEKSARFLGITGHFDPASLLEGLRRYDFDCILMALNAADRHHLPFQDELLSTAVSRKMGIIGMKVPARGRLLQQARLSMKECVGYTWTLPVSTVIIGCDTVAQLEENVSLARAFKPLPAETMAKIESRTRDTSRECAWYKRGGSEPWG